MMSRAFVAVALLAVCASALAASGPSQLGATTGSSSGATKSAPSLVIAQTIAQSEDEYDSCLHEESDPSFMEVESNASDDSEDFDDAEDDDVDAAADELDLEDDDPLDDEDDELFDTTLPPTPKKRYNLDLGVPTHPKRTAKSIRRLRQIARTNSTNPTVAKKKGCGLLTLGVLTLNLFNSLNATASGPQHVASLIRSLNAKVVLLQEASPVVVKSIRKSLGKNWNSRSQWVKGDNQGIAILSPFKIAKVYKPVATGTYVQAPPALGVKLVHTNRNGKTFYFRAFTAHIPNVPPATADIKAKGKQGLKQVMAAVEAEQQKQGVYNIIATLLDSSHNQHRLPTIFGGDLNQPSVLDHTKDSSTEYSTKRNSPTFQVDWPISVALIKSGFRDTYRIVHSDANLDTGFTWPDVMTDSRIQDRIDYIYMRNAVRQAGVINGPRGRFLVSSSEVISSVPGENEPWISDHFAVFTVMTLQQ